MGWSAAAAVVGGLLSRNAAKRADATQRQAVERQEQMQQQELEVMKMQAAPVSKVVADKPVMPTTDTAAVQNAKKKSIASQIARRGRASTILTGGGNQSESLGG